MSRLLLSIDPGLRGCGCAWWETQDEGWHLRFAAYVPSLPHATGGRDDDGPVAWNATVGAVELAHAARFPDREPDVLAVEQMKVYTRGPGDPRDLLALAAIGGGLVRAFWSARPVGLLPSEWKGQVPRDVFGHRMEKRLRERGLWERVEVPKRKTHLNDVMHAVGVGQFLIDRGRA